MRAREQKRYYEIIRSLAQQVNAKDPYTFGHIGQVERLGVITGRELGLDMNGRDKDILSAGLLLHDVAMEAPFGRRFPRAGMRCIEFHEDDIFGLHFTIGNARWRDEEAAIGPYADVSGRPLVDAAVIHEDTCFDDVLTHGLVVHGDQDRKRRRDRLS